MPDPEPPSVPSHVHPRARWLAGLLCVGAAAFVAVMMTLPPPGNGPAEAPELPRTAPPPVVATSTVTPAVEPVVAPVVAAREPPPAAVAPIVTNGVIDASALPRNVTMRIDRHPARRRTSVAPGRHVIVASVDGYLPITDTVTVRRGDTLRWTPKLVVQPPAVRPVATGRSTGGDEAACRQAFAAANWTGAQQSCRTAARAGSAYGRRAMASLFQHGTGVVRSDDSAAVWYEQAASAGDAESMHELGLAFEHGRGVRKDQSQAVQWYTRGANAGNAASQLVLGDGFEKGHLGLEKDRARAVEWYRKAAAQGNRDAADRLKKLGQQ